MANGTPLKYYKGKSITNISSSSPLMIMYDWRLKTPTPLVFANVEVWVGNWVSPALPGYLKYLVIEGKVIFIFLNFNSPSPPPPPPHGWYTVVWCYLLCNFICICHEFMVFSQILHIILLIEAAVAQWFWASNIFRKSTSEWSWFESSWFCRSGFEFAKTQLLILNH